ncbi:MAG TPA: TetR/AcrR family transcriptional regulator [Anaeromyxobacter sp.]|nr:TetR/AcrR family transcriptional regulator [Anaeromyxobacter sp.]
MGDKLSRQPAAPPRPEPNRRVRARTYESLIRAAMDLARDGRVPSIAEMAGRAQVSRATAYRYFPSRSKLITAVVDRSLGPVRSWKSRERDGRARVLQLFNDTFPRFTQFEPQMRAAVQLSLEHWALERAGLLAEEPYRRGHRRGLLRHALKPLERSLSAPTHDRLMKALSVVFGIEFYIVLKDIWSSPDQEVEAIARWVVSALVDAAIRERQARSRLGEGDPVWRNRLA